MLSTVDHGLLQAKQHGRPDVPDHGGRLWCGVPKAAILYGINLVSLFILVIQAMIQVSPMLTLFSLLPLPVL